MTETRMPNTYVPPFNTPLYWRYELSGELAAAVTAYLENRINGGRVDDGQIALIRDYICYWVNAPCWENDEFSTELAELRTAAKELDSAERIQEWTRLALDIGMDPL